MPYLSRMGRISQGPHRAAGAPAWRGTRGLRRGVLLCVAAALAYAVPACSPGSSAPPLHGHHRHNTAPRLHVAGNRLVNARGRPVLLHGVNRSGTEFLCVQGHGIFDGPTDQASISAMKAWGINAVRIPLNEGCWNGESYVDPAYAGANYQNAIKAYVRLVNANGMVVILDLHWSDGR